MIYWAVYNHEEVRFIKAYRIVKPDEANNNAKTGGLHP